MRSALGAVLHVIDVALCTLSRGRCRLRGYTLIAQAIGICALTLTRPHAGTVIQSVAPQHPLVRHFPRSNRVNQQRWATGSDCLAATVNGNFAGSVWTARTRYIDDEVRCAYELADAVHTVWNFDPYLAPRYRGGGRTCTRLWQAVDSHLQAEGIEWSFSRIALLNPASMAAPRRMHAQRVGTAVFLSLGSLQVSLFSISPFVHVGARHHSLPTVRLNVPTTEPALNPDPDPDPSPRPALTSGVAGTAGTAGAAASRGAGALDAPVALVLGLDSHGLAVARALADAGVGVYALEPNPAVPGAASNRVQRWFTLPNYSEEHLLPALRRVRSELRQHARVVLMVINDRQVTAVAHHLRELQSLYAIAWADQAPTILKLQCKDELEAYTRRQGLLYPRSALFSDATLPLPDHGLQFPIILKPARPLSAFKTLLAHHAGELTQHLQAHPGAMPILAQEYVPGGDSSIYFGALILDRGRVVHGMAGQKITSHPPALGQTTIAQTVDAPEVLRLTEQFFSGAGLSGPVSLELKRDPEGRYWVIEPTVGRTDFWVELCIGAGFNQPLMEWQLAAGLPVTPAGPAVHCVWYDTERDPMAWAGLCWQEKTGRPRGARQLFPYLGHADWLTVARALRTVGRSRLRRWLHRRRPPPAMP